VTTTGIDTSGATLIIVTISTFRGAGAPIAPTDNKGNSPYAATVEAEAGGGPTISSWYFFNPTVGTGHTFTYTQTTSFPSIIVTAFSGAASSPYDQHNTNSSSTLSGTVTMQPGSVTPSTNGQLILTAINAFIASSSPTIDSGFSTPIFVKSIVPGNTYSTAVSYLIQNTAAAVNPTWTFTPGGANAATIITTYK